MTRKIARLSIASSNVNRLLSTLYVDATMPSNICVSICVWSVASIPARTRSMILPRTHLRRPPGRLLSRSASIAFSSISSTDFWTTARPSRFSLRCVCSTTCFVVCKVSCSAGGRRFCGASTPWRRDSSLAASIASTSGFSISSTTDWPASPSGVSFTLNTLSHLSSCGGNPPSWSRNHSTADVASCSIGRSNSVAVVMVGPSWAACTPSVSNIAATPSPLPKKRPPRCSLLASAGRLGALRIRSSVEFNAPAQTKTCGAHNTRGSSVT